MRITRYNEKMLDACAELWWKLYQNMPYVHRPDSYDWNNGKQIGPHYFIKRLKSGLNNKHTAHWRGEVTDDSIFIALEGDEIEGILVSSVNREESAGNILSAFAQRDSRGREVADCLLFEALHHFRRLSLANAFSTLPTGSVEIGSPIHLALLDAGFAWDQFRWPYAGYGVFLGGSLEGWRLQPEIEEKIEKFQKEGVEIKRCSPNEAQDLRYYHSGENIGSRERNVRAIALVDGLVVGHAVAGTGTDWAEEPPNERIWGEAIPVVIPQFRNRGIGKVLYHLGVEWIVRQGATCSFIATGVDNPARFIYRSTPLRYWYTSISGMSKHLLE